MHTCMQKINKMLQGHPADTHAILEEKLFRKFGWHFRIAFHGNIFQRPLGSRINHSCSRFLQSTLPGWKESVSWSVSGKEVSNALWPRLRPKKSRNRTPRLNWGSCCCSNGAGGSWACPPYSYLHSQRWLADGLSQRLLRWDMQGIKIPEPPAWMPS